MKTIKLGFVGCGYMGQLAHLTNYAALPDVELVALADLRPDTPKEVARRYGIPKVYATHTELLKKSGVDAVVAIMHYGLHHAVVPDVLRAGKACLTEKPICVCVKTARSLERLARQTGTLYQVGYMKRCDPAARMAKARIAEWKASGEFGALRFLRVVMPPGDWIFQADPPINLGDRPAGVPPQPEPLPKSMTEADRQEYNAFINYYIHQVNLIRYLLGEDYTVDYVDPKGLLMVATSESGVTIALEMATFTLGAEWREDYVAGFERGRISLSLPAPMARQRAGEIEIHRQTREGSVYERPVVPPLWSMREQARLFVEAVRAGGPVISPPADAVKDLEVAEAYIACRRARRKTAK